MGIQEMSAQECRKFLAGSSFGRLGCALNNQPYVVPIQFAFEQDYVYSFGTFGQKIEWMRVNPKVCLLVDKVSGQFDWVSVIGLGSYEELVEPRYEHERAHARKLLDTHERWWLNALAERQLKSGEELIAPIFFRIRMESISGLKTASDGK
jgi:nitroimidazol reductase NimA-like FMN-containing flavoprotein (pyridoxamine 5'-phosphate oxidase superfamily)